MRRRYAAAVTDAPSRTPPRGRRILFRLVLVVSPVLLFLLAELVVRVVAPRQGSDDPYLRLSGTSSRFGEVEIAGERWFRVQHADLYAQNNVHFRVEKPKGTLRVFCLGGSAAAGWPHTGEQTFSAYLAQALRAAYPDRTVEVLNVGAHGYPSYRVRGVLEEVIRFQPDLLVLWCGNNEFVENRSYAKSGGVKRLVDALNRRSRLFEILLGTVAEVVAPTPKLDADMREAGVFIFSQLEQLALELRTDPAQLASVIGHYRFTIASMVASAREARVPLLLMTVPVNLRDWHPNVSRNGVQGEPLARWRERYQAGALALQEGRAVDAIAALRDARAADPTHAETAFLLGKALVAAGDCDAARAELVAAKDLDLTPFRAISALNDVLREIAGGDEELIFVDMERALLAGAKDCAPGFEWFLDYVHPTKAGNLEIARRLFDALVERATLGAPATRSFTRQDDGYDDATDLSVQLHVLLLHFFMHQEQSFVDCAERCIALVSANAADPSQDPLVQLLREGRDGMTAILEQRRRALRGEELAADAEARHQDWYRAYYGRVKTVVDAVRGGAGR